MTPHIHLYTKYPTDDLPVHCYYDKFSIVPGDRITHQGITYEALIDMEGDALAVKRDAGGAQIATSATGHQNDVTDDAHALVGVAVS